MVFEGEGGSAWGRIQGNEDFIGWPTTHPPRMLAGDAQSQGVGTEAPLRLRLEALPDGRAELEGPWG